MLICGSRAVGGWWVDPGQVADETTEAGSAIDRLVLTVLLSLAITILAKRRIQWLHVLKENKWLLLLFAYMAASIAWSEFPFVSLKRWIRAFGPIVMALVILSEQAPLEAFESVFRRTAYVLIPFSLALIKYFPLLGVAYGRWDGQQMWTGVTTHKNSLGQLCAVSVFLLIWNALRKSESSGKGRSKFRALGDFVVIGIAAMLLRGPSGSYSATSVSILTIGTSGALVMYRTWSVRRLVATHL
jgi:hypothetical protein